MEQAAGRPLLLPAGFLNQKIRYINVSDFPVFYCLKSLLFLLVIGSTFFYINNFYIEHQVGIWLNNISCATRAIAQR